MALRAILFDAVGTLIHPHPPVVTAYAAAAERFGVHLDEAQIAARFRAAFADREDVDRRNGYRTGPEWERSRWLRIVTEVFSDSASPQICGHIFGELWQHFARPESWQVDSNAALCWQALANRGLVVGVASNFDGRLIEIAGNLPPLNRADRLYLSARIGFRKPAAEFFHEIERDLGIDSSELLSVGDDLENDYRGAKSADWQALLLDSNRSQADVPQCDVIASLRELPERLADLH